MQPAVLLFPVPVQPDTVLNIVGTSYTLLEPDNGQWLQTLNAAPVVVTLSTDLAGGWTDAAELVLQRGGAGQVTLTPAAGVTIHTAGGLVLTTNYSTLQLKRVGPNSWVAVNSGGGGGGGASQFIQLTDVPPDYATFGGQLVRVRAAETGLEFADNLARLGINIGPDATHRFAVKAPASLFTAIPAAESGDGDFRLRINKELLGDLAVLDFMQGLVAKARIGLAFDNALHIMTTPDGTNFQDGINIDPTTGAPDLNMSSQTIASAATTDIGAVHGMRVTITGSVPITSLGTVANRLRIVGFAAALTLTHNATSLILPGGANIVTASGDTAIFSSDGAGNWRLRHYQRMAAGPDSQPLDPDLTAIAALSGVGLAARTAADAWALRQLVGPAAGLTITNPAGTAGNITFALADDLAAVEGLGTFGLAVRTALNAWATRAIAITAGQGSIANADGVSGNPTISLATALAALAALAPAADTAPYFTGASTASLMTVTAFIRTLLDDTTQAAALTTLGVDPTTLDARYVNVTGAETMAGTLQAAGFGVGITPLPTVQVYAVIVGFPVAAVFEGEGGAALQSSRVDSSTGAATITTKKARGTIAAKTAVFQNDQLGQFGWQAYGASTYVVGANFTASVTEPTPDNTHMGTRVIISACPLGSATTAELVRMEHATGLSLLGANPVIDQNRHFVLRVYTIATLLASPGSGQYEAACSDLGGGAGAVDWDGSKWRRRSDGGIQAVATDADFTLTTLTSAVQQVHTGTLTANRAITLSTTNAYVGARFRVTRTGAGAFNLSVGGLKNLVQNSWADVVYNGSAWVLAAAGTL